MCKRLLVTTIFVTSAFVDAPSYWNLGTISLMGALTLIYAVAIACLVLLQPRASCTALCRLWPLSGLFVFSFLQLFWHPMSVQAGQTLCMQWIFLGLMILMMTGERNEVGEPYIQTLLQSSTIFASFCYAIVFIVVGFGSEGLGAISFIAARSFALFSLLGIALFLSQWATGTRASFWLATWLILLIALSLSRTALVAGLLLFPLSGVRSRPSRHFAKFLMLGGVAVLALLTLAVSINALRLRFFGNNTFDDYVAGEASVDTSGRLTAWTVTLNSYLDAPLAGQGPGSANDLMDDVLYRLDIGHPLNEYLRFLHDEGVLGLILLLGGWGQLLALCWRAYRDSVSVSSPHTTLYLATLLSLVAAMLTMLTDNTASYIFIMGPLGVLVGTTLRPSPRSESNGIGKRENLGDISLAPPSARLASQI